MMTLLNDKLLPSSSLTEAQVADLLMKKYCALRAEIVLHIGFYKAHVRNFQLLAGALLASGGFVLANKLLLLPSADTWFVWCVGLFALSLTSNYLLLDVIDPQYALLLLAERLATIERELNEIAGRRLFIWESGATSRAYSGVFPFSKVLNPHILIAVCGMFLFLTMALAIPGYGYFLVYTNHAPASNYAVLPVLGVVIVASVILTAGTAYSIFSVLLLMRGKPRAYFETLIAAPLVQSHSDSGAVSQSNEVSEGNRPS